MEREGQGPPVTHLGPRSPRYQLGMFRTWLKRKTLDDLKKSDVRNQQSADVTA